MEQQAKELGVPVERVVYAHNLIGQSDPNNIEPSNEEVLEVIKAADKRVLEARQRLEENKKNLTKDYESTLIAIAPFREFAPAIQKVETMEDAIAVRNRQIELEELSQKYHDAAEAVAASLGLKIESFIDTRSSSEDALEPRFTITFDKETSEAKHEEILLFTSLMSDLGHEVQKSASVIKYTEKGNPSSNTVEFSVFTDFNKNAATDETSLGTAAKIRSIMNELGLSKEDFTVDWERGEIKFAVRSDKLSDADFQELLGKYNLLMQRLQQEPDIINTDGKTRTDQVSAETIDLDSNARRELYSSWLEQQGRNHDKLSGDTRELIVQAKQRADKFRANEIKEEIAEEYHKRANPKEPLKVDELDKLQDEVQEKLRKEAASFGGKFLYNISFHKDASGKQAMFIYGEENLLASEAPQTDLSRLHGTFTPERLGMRLNLLSRMMSNLLPDVAGTKLDEIETQITNLKEKLKTAEGKDATVLRNMLAQLSKQKATINNYLNGSKDQKSEVINIITLDRLVNELVRSVTVIKNTADEYKKNELDKVLTNFSAMRLMVLQKFAYLEGIELRRGINQEETDDETGAYATGNDGWGQEAGKEDPFKGIADTVRSQLKNCVLREDTPEIKKGKKIYKPIKDDLGYKMYMDPKAAYQEIAYNLADMLDDSDFYDKKTKSLPSLERLASRQGYGWVRDVVKYLKDHTDSMPVFYNAFRKDMVEYWHAEFGKYKTVNSLPSGDSFLIDAKQSVLYSQKFGDVSIWDKGVLGSSADIKKVKEFVSAAEIIYTKKGLSSEKEDLVESFATNLSDAIKGIGVNVSPEFMVDLVMSKLEASKKADLYQVIIELKGILAAADSAAKERDDNNKVDGALADNLFASTYNNFRRLGSYIGYFNGVSYTASFQDADATYYALSQPNFISTTVKALKMSDDARRQAYIMEKYGSDYFMYDEVNGWKNVMLRELFSSKGTEQRQRLARAKFNSFEGAKFSEMTAAQIREAEVNMFFAPEDFTGGDQTSAWYHVPNFSNARSTDFIRYTRERGKNFKDVLADKILVSVKQELTRIELGRIRKEKLGESAAVAREDENSRKVEEIARWDKNSTKFCMYPFFNTFTFEDVDPKTGTKYQKTIFDALAEFQEDKNQAKLDGFIKLGIKKMLGERVAEYLDALPLKAFKAAYIRETVKRNNITDPKEINALHETVREVKKEDVEAALGWNFYDSYNPVTDEMEGFVPSPAALGVATLLEQYAWNTHFMLNQIIELLTGDLAFYKTNDEGVDFVKRFKEVTAAGEPLFTQSKYGKRYSVIIGIRDHEQTSLDYNHIRKSLQEAVKDGRLAGQKGREMADFMLSHFENMNITDGQSFRTLPSLRSVMDMLGKWTPELQSSYMNLMQGKYSVDDIYTVFVAIKPFIFSVLPTYTGVTSTDLNLDDNGTPLQIGVPTQYKDSEALLLTLAGKLSGAMEKSAKARGLERFMRDYGIDIAKFESTTKVGLQGAIDLRYSPSFWEIQRTDGMPDNRKALADAVDKRRDNIIKSYTDRYRASEDKSKMKSPEAMTWTDYMDFARNTYLEWLKNGKLSQEDFNKIMADMEPTENEVYDLLERGATNYNDTTRLPNGIPWESNPNDFEEWETDGMDVHEAQDYRIRRTIELNPQTVKFVDNRNYYVVQPTREHFFDSEVVLGVQVKNLITADLPDTFEMTIRGRKFGAKETRKFFHSLLVENLLEDFEKLAETFDSTESLSKAISAAVASNPKYDDDLLKALTIEKYTDPITGVTKTRFHTPCTDPNNSYEIATIILSLFKNRIAKQKIFGGAAVIQTGWSFSKDLHAVRDAEGNLVGYECYLPAWSKLYFNKYRNEDGSYDFERMSKEHPELMRMIGYRIPTDHKHSMVPLIVKGFLPDNAGNNIVMAEEAIVAAGEDKDIDKKYLIMPAFTIPMNRNKFRRDFLTFKKKNGYSITAEASDEIEDAIDALMDGTIQAEDGSVAKEVFDFYLDNESKYGSPDIKKIEYDVNAAPETQTRAQRNNMIFDMAWGILTNKQVSEQTQMPTNFVRFKQTGFILDVAKNDKTHSPEELLSMSYSDVEKLSSDISAAKQYDPFSALNFSRHHKANMDALELVGIFAANLTVNAKYQGTNSDLTLEHHFLLGDKMVTSLVQIKDIDELLSSFNYSESINAATDNGKDPSIGRLGITTENAGLACTMFSTGASINMVGFFLNNPYMVKGGKATTKGAQSWLYHTVGEILFENRRRRKDSEILREDGITEAELLQCVIDGDQVWDICQQYVDSKNQDAVDSLIYGSNTAMSEEELTMLERQLKAMVYLRNYEDIYDIFSPRTKISRADSTNGAVSHTIAGAINQQRVVKQFHRFVEGKTRKNRLGAPKDPVIVSTESYPHNLGEDPEVRQILSRGYNEAGKARLREIFNASGLPVVQAAHTLGIEATQILMSKYFSTYTDRVVDVYNEIMDNSGIPNAGDKKSTAAAINVIQGLTTYALAGTDLFGTDGTMTIQQKREHYIYEFPDEFLKIRRDNPELKSLYYFRNIRIAEGKLRLDGASRLTRDTRLQAKADLDNVFLGRILPLGLSEQEKQNKMATYHKLIKDLLCYAFYTGQLSFGATSIGAFLSDDIKHAFPEYIDALRKVDSYIKNDIQKEHFIDQLFQQELIPFHTIDESKQAAAILGDDKAEAMQTIVHDDGSYTVPVQLATNSFLEGQPVRYLRRLYKADMRDTDGRETDTGGVKTKIYKLAAISKDGKTATYIPMNFLRVKDGTKFDPNSSFEEDAKLPDNTKKYDAFIAKHQKQKSVDDQMLDSIFANIEAAGGMEKYDAAFSDVDSALAARSQSAPTETTLENIEKKLGEFSEDIMEKVDAYEEQLSSTTYDSLEGIDFESLPQYEPNSEKTGKPC